MRIGYARVSTQQQDNAAQLAALRAAGCSRIFEEKVSAGRWDRPELRRLLDHLAGLHRGRIVERPLVAVALVLIGLSTYSQDTPGFFVLGYVIFGVFLSLALNAIPGVGEMLRSIGRYSYFMYFFHFWVLRWIEDLYRGLDLPGNDQTSLTWNIGTLLAIWIVATFVSWAVGWVSWRILEKPILNVARRYVH